MRPIGRRVNIVVALIVAVVLLSAALLSACTSTPAGTTTPAGTPSATPTATGTPTATPAVITMRLNHVGAKGHPTNESVQWFAQQVEERTKGRVKINVYIAAELATVMEALETLGAGAYEIGFVSPGFFPAKMPLAALPHSMMGIFSNVKQAEYHFDEVYKRVPAVVEEATAVNLHYLYTNVAPSYLLLSKAPIEKLSDLKGVKVRTFGAYFPKHVENFGAVSVSIPAVEAYDALATGAIQAIPSIPSDHVVYGFDQIAKHLWRLKFGAVPWAVIYMNLNTWNKLPKDIQDIFTQVSTDTLAYNVQVWDKAESQALDTLKQHGVTFHEASKADQDAWNAYGQTLTAGWAAEMEKQGKGAAAKTMVDLLKEMVTKYPD